MASEGPRCTNEKEELTFPDTFVNKHSVYYEGYWWNESSPGYPKPTPHDATNHLLSQFISKLKDVQLKTEKDCCDGYSWCRLCGKRNNGSDEFYMDYNGGTLRWPSGLLHYYAQHHVHPSKPFYDFICKTWQSQQKKK